MESDSFFRIGKRLYHERLVAGPFGNMSIRTPDEAFLITRTGSYLDDPGDPVRVPISGEVPRDASTEWRVHRAVYQQTRHHAVVHAHPPYAIAASLLFDEIIPLDSEGKMFCPTIPIANGEPGTPELAEDVADCLALVPLCIARGHGTFTAGKTLEEACMYTSLAEHSCRILSVMNSFR